jgi:hypothetical protein
VWRSRAGEGALAARVADPVDPEGARVALGARVAVGARVAWGARVARGTPVARGALVASVRDGRLADVVLAPAAVLDGGGRSELTLVWLTSRPAASMANHAVTDTPATATSQITAMPTARRSFSTMRSL